MSTEKTAEQLAREWLDGEGIMSFDREGPMLALHERDVASLAALLEAYGERVRKEALGEALNVARDSATGFRLDGLDGYAFAADKVAERIVSSLATTRGAK